MKRKTWAVTFILALLFSLASATQLAKEAKANPYPTRGVDITLHNPQNRTYNNNTIPVAFTATQVHFYSEVTLAYSLDNEERNQILNVTATLERIPINPPFTLKTMKDNFLLFNVSEGWHTMTVYCHAYGLKRYSDEDSIDFFVDTIPIVSFLSFENKTFETSDVPLNFSVNQAFSKIAYTLDGKDNVTISGNTTLTEVLNGDHNVTVYVTDETGNTVASETILFTVAKPEPMPTLLAAASVATVALVGTGMLVYFKKRKH